MALRLIYLSFMSSVLQTHVSAGLVGRTGYNVRPFNIDLSGGVTHMLDLVRSTKLPDHQEYPGVGDTAGIALQTLKNMQAEWVDNFDWETEQAYMNQLETFNYHCTAAYN